MKVPVQSKLPRKKLRKSFLTHINDAASDTACKDVKAIDPRILDYILKSCQNQSKN